MHSNQDFQIAFFDIDGTLIDPRTRKGTFSSRVPDSTRRALKELKKRNILPVIATGRDQQAISEFADDLEISSYITSNGQMVTHLGKLLSCTCIPGKDVAQIVEELHSQNQRFILETTDGLLEAAESAKLDYEHVLQVVVYAPAIAAPIRISSSDYQIVRVGPEVLNIHCANISKATGIQTMLKILEIEQAAALAFGDEENDLAMFSAVGLPVAMGNGTAAVKEKAGYVTEAVWEDGIYKACLHLKLFSEGGEL